MILGVRRETDIADIRDELKILGYHFSSVSRMKRGARIFPLVIITASKTEEERGCFDIVHIVEKSITTEPKAGGR